MVGRSLLCASLKLHRRRATLGCSLRLFVTLSSRRPLCLWPASPGSLSLALVEAWDRGVAVLFLRVLPSLGGSLSSWPCVFLSSCSGSAPTPLVYVTCVPLGF